mmetsp:Transcript_12146/g.15907  ORF Transcript_12146/g.15907 Transcript_12146/m.15907 type:complete len:350 (+) Transcript_12146:107-1156(+)
MKTFALAGKQILFEGGSRGSIFVEDTLFQPSIDQAIFLETEGGIKGYSEIMSKEDYKDGEGHFEGNWKTITFDEVEIGSRIGGGGVGVVYNGWYKDEPVALKTLFDPRVDEKLKQEYLDELLTMSALQHPNIVEFIGACMEPPDLFFVMELCNASLFDLLHNQRAQFCLKDKIAMAIDIAKAMQYLHNRDPCIIHRDLKSMNLLMSNSGVLKLCDFGLVKTKNTTAGTPCYMAPELLKNSFFNKKVDVYAFAILLWEILEEQIPFCNCEPQEIMKLVGDGERPHLSMGYNEEVRCLIQDCWAQDPADRPDFDEILGSLELIDSQIPEKTSVELLQDDFGGDALDGLLGK